MSKVITVSNHKGGVGKTTSVANIGAGLALLGKRVLMIDLDPQANLSLMYGLMEHECTIYGVIRGEYPMVLAITPAGSMMDMFPGTLDLVPSTLDLSGAEVEMNGEPGREFILKELLEPLRESYDYILIDSPPSLGLLTINAMVASDEVFIPIQSEYLSFVGMTKLIEVIDKIKMRLNKKLKIGGVFITRYDQRKVLNRNIAEIIEQHFKDEVFKTRIRENIAIAETPSLSKNIFGYNPKSAGAEDYMELCKEIINK